MLNHTFTFWRKWLQQLFVQAIGVLVAKCQPKGRILYQRSEVKPYFLSLSLYYSIGSSYLYLGGGEFMGACWVPQVLVEVCMFPPYSLSVMFLASLRLEAAALIKTNPSPPTSSSHSLSLSYPKLPPQEERERQGGMERADEGREMMRGLRWKSYRWNGREGGDGKLGNTEGYIYLTNGGYDTSRFFTSWKH